MREPRIIVHQVGLVVAQHILHMNCMLNFKLMLFRAFKTSTSVHIIIYLLENKSVYNLNNVFWFLIIKL